MKKWISEFIGTAVLVLFGCGSAVLANLLVSNFNGFGAPLGFTTLLIAAAFGLALAAMAYTIGHISGCHINPAVSFGMLIAGRMNVKDFFAYISAQFLGGIAGAGVLALIFGGSSDLAANSYGDATLLRVNMWGAVLVEFILTFIFVWVVLTVTAKKELAAVSGLIIGLTLTVVHIFGTPLTGTGVNPARSFGPALVCWSNNNFQALSQVWVFIIAPLLGAALAASVYTLLNAPAAKADEKPADAEKTAKAPKAEQTPAEDKKPEAKPAAKAADDKASEKPADEKPADEKPADSAPKAPAKKPAAKKPAAKTGAAKPAAKKPAAKKTAAKKTAAKPAEAKPEAETAKA